MRRKIKLSSLLWFLIGLLLPLALLSTMLLPPDPDVVALSFIGTRPVAVKFYRNGEMK